MATAKVADQLQGSVAGVLLRNINTHTHTHTQIHTETRTNIRTGTDTGTHA